MKVLVACEFSGVVREAFRKRGHEAWSCDLIEDESGISHPCHLQMDALVVMNYEWDLIIAHPPCTYISNMSNCRIKEPGRVELREVGMKFFMCFTNLNCPKVCIENPRGLPERIYRKPDQILHPYQFGHRASKATCLWLKGLPGLKPTSIVEPQRKWDGKRWRTWVDTMSSHNAKNRSITFQGIANAMAEQWG